MKYLNAQRIKETAIILFIGILIGFTIGGFLWILVRQPQGTPLVLATRSRENIITIYISGNVESPGVYELPVGSRINDAIEAAGGILADSNIDLLNLAQVLSDSDHVYIPAAAAVRNLEISQININYGTQEQLETLAGIGSTLAQQIIEYRTENGLFTTIEEIQKVPGIGPSTFEKIKNHITVGD
jgi:competence protein ComEA